MSSIKLRRSGLYYFTAQILSYLITILYAIYVARELPKIDYGIYGYIISLWTTIDVFKAGFNFWAGRMMARGKKCLKTLIMANLLVSIPTASLLFIIISSQAKMYGGNYLYIGILSVAYILTSYLYGSLVRSTSMVKPHLLGIDPILNSIIKLVIGIPLIYYIGIMGALATLVISNITVSIALYKINISEIEVKIDLSLVREWLKGAWYPILISLSTVLMLNIQLIILGALEATTMLPSYNMAYRASRFIQFSGALSIALVPALLRGRDPEKSIFNVLDLTLLVAIPVTIGLITYPGEIVYLFGWDKYLDAKAPLIILAISTFINLFNIIGRRGIFGLGEVDADYTIDIGRLVRSEMMQLLIAIYISLGVGIVGIILLYPHYGIDGLATSQLLSSITLFILIGVKTLRIVDGSALLVKVGKYLVASVIAVASIYFIPKHRSLYIGLAATIAIAVYSLTIYLIDNDVRELVKKILFAMNI